MPTWTSIFGQTLRFQPLRQMNDAEAEGKTCGFPGFVPGSRFVLQLNCSTPWTPSGIKGLLLQSLEQGGGGCFGVKPPWA